MLKTFEDISTTKKRLKIEIPAEVIEKEIMESLSKVRSNAALPGFRQGKAPLGIIENKFGKKVETEVLEKMIPKEYVSALREAKLTPIANPVIEEDYTFSRNQPVTMTFVVEVLPRIEPLIYEKIEVKEVPVTVEASDIEGVLKRIQDEKATFEPSEGPVAMNDLITMDYSGAELNIGAKDMSLRVGEAAFFPREFFEKLAGAEKGRELIIDTQFPAEHINRNIAGKKIPLTVVVTDIKKKTAPGLDDELAKDMGFETLEAFKKNISEVIAKSKKAETESAQKAEIMNKLVEMHVFDVPESLVDKETEVLAANAMVITADVKPGDDDKDETAFNPDLRNDAIKKVKAAVLIEMIGQKEGLRVTEDDIKNAITGMSRSYSITPEQLMKFYTSKEGSLDRLKNSIFEEKVLDLILSKAVVVKGE